MKEKGFTLVEVIIAMAIMGVIAVSFIPLLAAQYVNIQKTGDKSDTTYNAVEKAEESILKANKNDPSDPIVVDPSDPNSNIKIEDDKVKIPGILDDTEGDVTTIKVKGEGREEGTEIIVGVPKE